MDFLYVAMGGAIGSTLRYFVGGFFISELANHKFPYSTFVINVVGCLLIGLLGAIVVKHGMLSQGLRLFLITGILGGFTTFSAFGLDAFYLMREGHYFVAATYIFATVTFGLIGLFLAFHAIPQSAS
jgi:CrcB protein